MQNIRTFFSFIFSVFKNSKVYLFVKTFLAILQGVFPVVTTILPQYLLDSIIDDRNISYFIAYVILYVCLQFFVPFFYSIIEIWLDKLLFKVNIRITNDMLDKMYGMKYEYYDDPESSNIFNRAFGFVTGAGVNTFSVFLEMIALSITMCSYAYIIARFNLLILIIVIMSVAINYCIMLKRTKTNVSFNNYHTLFQRKSSYLKNVILNKYIARDMHFNDTFDNVKNQFNNVSFGYNRELVKKNISMFGLNQIGSIFQGILTLTIMLYFGNMLYEQLISVGEYTVSLNASMQFSSIVFSFINLVSSVYAGILESENYRNFRKLTDVKITGTPQCLLHENIEIEFKNVSYRYFGTTHNALTNFTYEFCEGKIYAIIGCNGSGKSTLIKLILGLYKPSDGEIKVNQLNMHDIDLMNYYNNLSVVSQDFTFVDGISIRENIGIDSLNKQELFAKLADRYNFPLVKDIECDYSKSFSEEGLELSGGEKQKLAVIRALLRDGKIVIFDEPTSAIDPVTEEKIFSDLRKNTRGKMTIFITHNHNMAKYADEVLILDKGNLLAHGSFEELREKELLYDSE